MDVDNVAHFIAVCCVLHNLCEIHHDSFNEEWLQEVDLDQPDVPSTSTQSSTTRRGGDHVPKVYMLYTLHRMHRLMVTFPAVCPFIYTLLISNPLDLQYLNSSVNAVEHKVGTSESTLH